MICNREFDPVISNFWIIFRKQHFMHWIEDLPKSWIDFEVLMTILIVNYILNFGYLYAQLPN